ncbi:FbpB family small basic protein [Evansella cellulosilytica]|uniref:FbpB family small basic protein n=1 Tax=Evansella cellulosilytica (strain ATCC 21833 / DSM 2522 / FERM P-1141 / JCM 9156 / N-4) TaxID=649639 RepID=E6U1P3_EVAC2|nr:FbpB family small basic protein [Evansella cellulosilytica]ADU30406.1 hypothetical protein Bcell_2145 [Evansella cellulosilytica DSM 2522]
MMNKKKMRFDELIRANKQELMKNPKELEKIEERLDKKHMDRLLS